MTIQARYIIPTDVIAFFGEQYLVTDVQHDGEQVLLTFEDTNDGLPYWYPLDAEFDVLEK